VNRRCGEHRVLEPGVLPAAEGGLGQEPIAQPLQGSASARVAPHHCSASAARRRSTSPGKVSLGGCSGATSLASSSMPASRAGPSSRTRRAVMASSAVGRFLPGMPRR
jgi:hypothetical protein